MKKFNIILLSSFIIFNTYGLNKNICGETDERMPSNDSRVARGTNVGFNSGCTVTMIGKSCALSAGHCVGSLKVISFNMPLSSNKIPLPSGPEDTYYRMNDYIRYQEDGSGKDWAVIKIHKNQRTGLFPGDAQGFYNVRLNKKVSTGETVRITGHGRDYNDNYKNLSQQTSTGQIKKIGGVYKKSLLGYDVDTMGGNSGSSIVLESSKEIIGIHSHSTCKANGRYNKGVLISKNKPLKQAIKNCLKWEKTLEATAYTH
jgi:V8-like Glu-specific endopeptidase